MFVAITTLIQNIKMIVVSERIGHNSSYRFICKNRPFFKVLRFDFIIELKQIILTFDYDTLKKRISEIFDVKNQWTIVIPQINKQSNRPNTVDGIHQGVQIPQEPRAHSLFSACHFFYMPFHKIPPNLEQPLEKVQKSNSARNLPVTSHEKEIQGYIDCTLTIIHRRIGRKSDLISNFHILNLKII